MKRGTYINYLTTCHLRNNCHSGRLTIHTSQFSLEVLQYSVTLQYLKSFCYYYTS